MRKKIGSFIKKSEMLLITLLIFVMSVGLVSANGNNQPKASELSGETLATSTYTLYGRTTLKNGSNWDDLNGIPVEIAVLDFTQNPQVVTRQNYTSGPIGGSFTFSNLPLSKNNNSNYTHVLVNTPRTDIRYIGYTVCYNTTTCHNEAPINTAGFVYHKNIYDNSFADIWLHFEKVPQVTVNLSAAPNPAEYEGSTTLTWNSTGAKYCWGYDGGTTGWYGEKKTSGSQIVTGLTKDMSFKLVCRYETGVENEDTVTVKVKPNPAIYCDYNNYPQDMYYFCIYPDVDYKTYNPEKYDREVEAGKYQTTDPVDFDWGDGVVAGSGKSDKVVLAIRTKRNFDGDYVFHVSSDDGVVLEVDGKKVLDKWVVRSNTEDAVQVNNLYGNKNITLRYFENTGKAQLKFWWEKVEEEIGTPPLPETNVLGSLQEVRCDETKDLGYRPVTATGNANDPDSPAGQVEIKFYQGGDNASGNYLGNTYARSSQQSSTKTFSFTFDANDYKKSSLYAYAVDIQTGEESYIGMFNYNCGGSQEPEEEEPPVDEPPIDEPEEQEQVEGSLYVYDAEGDRTSGPVTLPYNSDVKLQWNLDNFDENDACKIDSNNGKYYDLDDDSGQTTFDNVTKNTTYTLTCNQIDLDSVKVNIEKQDEEKEETDYDRISGQIDEARCDNGKWYESLFTRFIGVYANQVKIEGTLDDVAGMEDTYRIGFYLDGDNYIGSTYPQDGRFEFAFNPLLQEDIAWNGLPSLSGDVYAYVIDQYGDRKVYIDRIDYDCDLHMFPIPEREDKPAKQIGLEFGVKLRNSGGSLKQEITVAEGEKEPVLEWSSKNTTACVAGGDWGNRNEYDAGKKLNGTETLYDLMPGKYEYVLTCRGEDEKTEVEQRVIVNVTEGREEIFEYPVGTREYAFRIVDQSPDAYVKPGEKVLFWVTLKNVGRHAWRNEGDNGETYLINYPVGEDSPYYTKYGPNGYTNWISHSKIRRGDSPMAEYGDVMSFGFYASVPQNPDSDVLTQCAALEIADGYGDTNIAIDQDRLNVHPICWDMIFE